MFVAVQEHRCAVLRDFLKNGIRTETIFNGVPCVDNNILHKLREAKRRELGLTECDFLVLGVGRLVEQKRPLEFLRLAKELHMRVPNMRFLWIGDGKLAEQWQRAVVRENLSGVVSCAGWQADVIPYLAAGDLLMHVAEFEGLPFVLIEAMAAGLPCAVTRELSCEIRLFNEDNVLLVDDIGELADKAQNRVGLSRVATGGRRLVKDTLSARHMIESYERLYCEVMASMPDDS